MYSTNIIKNVNTLNQQQVLELIEIREGLGISTGGIPKWGQM